MTRREGNENSLLLASVTFVKSQRQAASILTLFRNHHFIYAFISKNKNMKLHAIALMIQ